VNHRDSKSISNLLETAKHMVGNGATPDVVNFTQAIVDEITGNVFPIMLNIHNEDQQRVRDRWAQFGVVIANMEQALSEIRLLNAEDSVHSTNHRTCRAHEDAKCTAKQTCDYELWDLWLQFVEEESEFRVRERQISDYFCAPDANGTLESFRTVSANHFLGYIAEYDATTMKFEFEVSTDNYDDKRPQCELHYQELVENGAECDALQTSLEDISCQRAIAVRSVRTDYTCNWRRALDEYEAIVAEVEALEADRKTECQALEVVRCLLGRAQERNGRPCDEVTDEAQVEYTHCEVQGQTVDCTWLDIIYPDVPPYPPVPNPVDHPCSASFIATEYNNRESGLEGLTFMPTAVFHSPSGFYHQSSDGNAHCNQPQPCQTCPGMDDPVEECSIPPSATPALWQQHLEDNTKCQANDELTTEVANQAECQAMSAVRGHSYYSFRSTALSNGNHKCRTSATCGESDLRTGTSNPWNVFRAFTLAGTDLKCPHQHGDRLFRNPASGTSSITLEQCRQECLMTAGCNHFSHGGGGVCMGCVSLTNAQTHEGFNAYDM